MKDYNKDCLAIKIPELVKEWHGEKNKELTPYDVTYGSNKKVWWKCDKGHEWEAPIKSRYRGGKCPYCIGRKVCNDNCLANVNPELSKEWNIEKNGELTPYDVTCGSNKKVWWKCSKGHEWEASISNRSKKIGTKCPYCINQKIDENNSLEALNPELAKEWHGTKNIGITAKEVSCKSKKKVWWKCSKGHEWEATVQNRSNGSNCPQCNSERKTSFEEMAIYYFIKNVFKDAVSRYEIECDKEKIEVDVYIPSYSIGIEYDGWYWHKDRYEKDKCKNLKLEDKISLIRVRDVGLEDIEIQNGISIKRLKSDRKDLENVIKYIFNYIVINKELDEDCINTINNLIIDIEAKSLDIIKLIEHNEKENSLYSIMPELVKEWNSDKNSPITPKAVSYASRKKVWWKCSKGHEWSARISDRSVKDSGCPYCSGNKVGEDNCLAVKNKQLAKQWHPTKNGELTPYEVTCGSNKKVWWKCSKGHEWRAVINSRNRSNGCPYCSDKIVGIDNCLATKNKKLAEQWHPTKNEELTPYDVTCGSNKKVWWKCSKGHEWIACINHRNNGSGCPYCSGQKVCKNNSIASRCSNIYMYWDKEKNGTLTPEDLTCGSHKKVWWKCENCNHSYERVVYCQIKKYKKVRCPRCKQIVDL